MIANSRNNFGLLSSSQEPSQIIAQATGAAKNRKKKEKAKARKAKEQAADDVESVPNGADRTPDAENQKPAQQTTKPAGTNSFSALQRRFAQNAQNSDCWRVWDEWLRQAKSDGKEPKYTDAEGSAFTFQQALTSSPALPKAVSNAVYRQMAQADRDLLAALLTMSLPAPQTTCKGLAAVICDVSQQLDSASSDTKDAAAASLEGVIRSFLQAVEASDAGGMQDVESLAKEIAAKQPALHKAISQPDTVQTQTVDMAMQVVQLLRRKLEGEQCLASGVAPAMCNEAKQHTEHLASVLTLHACAASPTPAATTTKSGNTHVDGVIISLTQRIATLEAELASARAELRDAQAVKQRSNGRAGKHSASPGSGVPGDNVMAAKEVAHRLENIVLDAAKLPSGSGMKTQAHGVGGASAAAAESTLAQLLDLCMHTAQMQDKLMDKLAEQLEFARARLVSASNMQSDSGIANARKLFSNVRAQSSETHDAAARLEAIINALDGTIASSPSYSALRPMAMQVKQIAWQVYNAHNHLTANARPDAILEAAQTAAATSKDPAGRSITLEEILAMDMSSKNSNNHTQASNKAAQSSSSGPDIQPSSRAATQGSSPAPSTAAGIAAAVPIQVAAPVAAQAHAGLVYAAPVPAGQAVQAVGIPTAYAAPAGGAQVHTMHAIPPQAVAQSTMPLQQYVPQQLFSQDGAPVIQGIAGAPVVAAAPVASQPGEEQSNAASRFGSTIAAAEAAAANLAKAMAKPGVPSGGRGGSGGRRGGTRARRT